mmetsp:Transcript_24653/g.36950  ORF Transcript_24653/g.36950 Transcript_24653/m.36950 type:complete len:228 (-) Transcript_24653:680-1363(-)
MVKSDLQGGVHGCNHIRNTDALLDDGFLVVVNRGCGLQNHLLLLGITGIGCKNLQLRTARCRCEITVPRKAFTHSAGSREDVLEFVHLTVGGVEDKLSIQIQAQLVRNLGNDLIIIHRQDSKVVGSLVFQSGIVRDVNVNVQGGTRSILLRPELTRSDDGTIDGSEIMLAGAVDSLGSKSMHTIRYRHTRIDKFNTVGSLRYALGSLDRNILRLVAPTPVLSLQSRP